MAIQRIQTVSHKDDRNELAISIDDSKKSVTIQAIKHRIDQRDSDEPCELDLPTWKKLLRELVSITPGIALHYDERELGR